jgi:hypothetical protein
MIICGNAFDVHRILGGWYDTDYQATKTVDAVCYIVCGK